MDQELKKIFEDYINLLLFECTNTKAIDNTDIEIKLLFDQLETNQLFKNLITETRHSFSEYNVEKDKSANVIDIYMGEWSRKVKNFFRRSNIYFDIYTRGEIDIESAFNKYNYAFNRKEINESYFAPLEYINFADESIEFDQFQIKIFTVNELNNILQNRINKIFYPSAFIDVEQIKDYWFLCVKKSIPAPKMGVIHLEQAEGMNVCHVDIEYANYPEAILPFIKSLSLFDWGSDWLKESFKNNNKEIKDIELGWLRFHIPFVYIINDNLLDFPDKAPDLSLLSKDQYFDESLNDVLWRTPSYIDFNKEETNNFKQFVTNVNNLLTNLKTEQYNWKFHVLALDFFIKAFFSNGIEQLLWHIISIEALLGQEESSTKNITNRIGSLLGKQEAKYFREKLYKFRSDLVHGKKFKEDVYINHLWQARSLSRRIILWFNHYLSRIQSILLEQQDKEQIPTREDILLLIDLDLNTRNRLKRLLINLPTTFPKIEEWIK